MLRKKWFVCMITLFVLNFLLLACCPPFNVSETPQSKKDTATTSKKQDKESADKKPKVEVIDTNPKLNAINNLTVPFVIENKGNVDAYNAKVIATAYSADGKVIGTASDDARPTKLEPGKKGYGAATFDGAIEGYKEIKYQVTTGEQPSLFQGTRLEVIEHNLIKNEYNHRQIVGTVKNNTDKQVASVLVYVACFNKDGKIVHYEYGGTEMDIIPVGSTSPFSVSLFDNPFESYEIVIAEGY